jgi:hypothetical protein
MVLDSSSTLDDSQEHAETISANHMNMCKFSTLSDPGYRKISAEIKIMYRNISSQGQYSKKCVAVVGYGGCSRNGQHSGWVLNCVDGDFWVYISAMDLVSSYI